MFYFCKNVDFFNKYNGVQISNHPFCVGVVLQKARVNTSYDTCGEDGVVTRGLVGSKDSGCISCSSSDR